MRACNLLGGSCFSPPLHTVAAMQVSSDMCYAVARVGQHPMLATSTFLLVLNLGLALLLLTISFSLVCLLSLSPYSEILVVVTCINSLSFVLPVLSPC